MRRCVAMFRRRFSRRLFASGVSAWRRPARLGSYRAGGSLMFNKAMSYLPGFLDERIVKRVLEAKAVKPDENAMYLYTNFLEMIWPYDDRGRLIGEDVWEPTRTRPKSSSSTLPTS